MLKLPFKPTKPFVFKSETYEFVEHHLSIYQKYNDDDVFSPLHYTTTYKKGSKIIIIRAYFDKEGNYLSSRVCFDKAEEKPTPLSDAEKKIVEELAEQYARSLLDQLSQELIEKQGELGEIKKKMLQELDDASKLGSEHPEYKKLLGDTIKAFEEHEKLFFNPGRADRSVKQFLEKYQNNLKAAEALVKNSQKKKVKLPSELKKEWVAPLRTNVTTDAVSETSKIKQSVPHLLTSKNSAEMSNKSDELSAQLKEQERMLYNKLDQAVSVTEMSAIVQEIDMLNNFRGRVLAHACVDGNIGILKQYLDKKNWESLEKGVVPMLLSTCVCHNQPLLFDYILSQVNNHYLKYYYSMPFGSESGGGPQAVSLLELAYVKKNFDFFEALLKRHKYNPNLSPVQDYSILMRAASLGDSDYVSALLIAGADPNATVADHLALTQLTSRRRSESNAAKTEFEQKGVAVDVRHRLNTALHLAAMSANQVGVKLLLEHALTKSNLRNADGFTAFGFVVFKDKNRPFPLNKDIIRLFLKHGHKIDEKQAAYETTGLMAACSTQDLEAVTTLLDLGANPCEKQPKSKMTIDGVASSLRLTPLFLSLINQNEKIVEKILSYPIDRSELEDIYQQWKFAATISPRFVNKYAIAVHKAGDFKNAELLFREALKTTQEEDMRHGILFNLGACCEAQEKKLEAIKVLDQCIEIRTKKLSATSNFLAQNGLKELIKKATDRRNKIRESLGASVMTNSTVKLHIHDTK